MPEGLAINEIPLDTIARFDAAMGIKHVKYHGMIYIGCSPEQWQHTNERINALNRELAARRIREEQMQSLLEES